MKIRFLAFSLLVSLSASASDTCVAIRGNGELIPAHWGALAHEIETFGTPRAVAGGSSASITAFILESIIKNPLIGGTEPNSPEAINRRNARAAYLVKSIQGFVENIGENPKLSKLKKFIQSVQNQGTNQIIPLLVDFLKKSDGTLDADAIKKLKAAVVEARVAEIFSGPVIRSLLGTLNEIPAGNAPSFQQLLTLKKQLTLIKSTLEVFGKFDAKNDPALLVRPGIVNFRALGELFGKMGNFYALQKAPAAFVMNFEKHLDLCALTSFHKPWPNIAVSDPTKAVSKECVDGFKNLIKNYPSVLNPADDRVNENISGVPGFTSLISTAVADVNLAKGIDAATVFRTVQSKYLENLDQNEAEKLNIPHTEDIRFGYWGDVSVLNRINRIFHQSDSAKKEDWMKTDKSSRFLSLGNTTWIEALARSPAEPGLSAFLPLSNDPKDTRLSLGGWSDLQPVLVLKAAGCTNTIYITRKGGDSLFGQGVANRIVLNQEVDWERLNKANPVSRENNARGMKDDGSLWSRMFNLGNPKSSFSQSLLNATAVVCTDWDKFNAFDGKQWDPIFTDAYNAPIFRAPWTSESGALPAFKPDRAGCVPQSI